MDRRPILADESQVTHLTVKTKTGEREVFSSVLKNVMSAGKTRQNSAKKAEFNCGK
jgi:hypothetical protein